MPLAYLAASIVSLLAFAPAAWVLPRDEAEAPASVNVVGSLLLAAGGAALALPSSEERPTAGSQPRRSSRLPPHLCSSVHGRGNHGVRRIR